MLLGASEGFGELDEAFERAGRADPGAAGVLRKWKSAIIVVAEVGQKYRVPPKKPMGKKENRPKPVVPRAFLFDP